MAYVFFYTYLIWLYEIDGLHIDNNAHNILIAYVDKSYDIPWRFISIHLFFVTFFFF